MKDPVPQINRDPDALQAALLSTAQAGQAWQAAKRLANT